MSFVSGFGWEFTGLSLRAHDVAARNICGRPEIAPAAYIFVRDESELPRRVKNMVAGDWQKTTWLKCMGSDARCMHAATDQ